MIPVYQNIFGTERGNCWASVYASLLHLKLEEVPNFVEHEDYWRCLNNFLLSHGLEYEGSVYNPNRDFGGDNKNSFILFEKELPEVGSINGYYDGLVYSPRNFDTEKFLTDPEYKPTYHAVVVDKDFNIVHDPHPDASKYSYPLADELGYNGVLSVTLWKPLIKK